RRDGGDKQGQPLLPLSMRSALTVPAAVLSALLAGPPAPARGERPPAAAAQSGIRVTFKLDPRLSGPTYGGERWVSPQTYSGANAQDAVEARVFAVDDKGRST